jgi:hypothetical protein
VIQAVRRVACYRLGSPRLVELNMSNEHKEWRSTTYSYIFRKGQGYASPVSIHDGNATEMGCYTLHCT